MFDIPILLILYKREDNAVNLINLLRPLKPKQIYIFADGPKNESEEVNCLKTREAVDLIDWECSVEKKFPTKNLGVALGPKAAIDWLFEQNEIGIILEDDILPSLDFFLFAKEMLHMYYDNEKVMHINAMNFHLGKKVVKESYYFSCITCPWGWATWKRAWKKFDFKMLDFYENIDFIDLPAYYKMELKHYKQILDNYKSETELYTWDFQWLYCVAKYNGVSIVPSRNLALNLGFEDINASNTHSTPKWVKKIKLETLPNITHPTKVLIDEWADELTYKEIVWNYTPKYSKWFSMRLRKILNKTRAD